MTAAREMLAELRGLDVHLRVTDEGRLRFGGRADVLTDELRRQLQKHKPELLRLLAPATDAHVRPIEPCRTCYPPERIGAGYYLLTLTPNGETHDG